jgi:antitoxin MazE
VSRDLDAVVAVDVDDRLIFEPGRVYIQCRYMAITTQVSKWGNSLGLRLPKSIAREAQLDEGDTVDVLVDNGTIVIRPSRPRYTLDELVGGINARNRHDATDWGRPRGRETW